MKNLVIGALVGLVVALLISSSLPPQNLRHGFANMETAFAQELEVQKLSKELEAEEQIIIDAEQKARATIEAKVAKFQENQSKLSEKARNEQQTAIGNEINSLQTQFTQRRQDLDTKRRNTLRDLENKNRLLLESIARKDGFDITWPHNIPLWISPDVAKKYDVTDKLIAEYNKAYPVKETKKGSAKPEPAKIQPGKSR